MAIIKKSEPQRALGKGDLVYEKDIAGVENIELTDEDDPDCAHATVFSVRDRWYGHFDFRYNKRLAQQHLETARQFHEAAILAWERRLKSPCLDNLYSATELAARAELLTGCDPDFRRGTKHSKVRSRFLTFARMGNHPAEHSTAYDKLTRSRYPMRYLRGTTTVSDAEVPELVRAVKNMINLVAARIGVRTSLPAANSVLP